MTARLFHCTTVNLRGDFWLWWPDAPFGARGDYATRKDAKEAMRAVRAAMRPARHKASPPDPQPA